MLNGCTAKLLDFFEVKVVLRKNTFTDKVSDKANDIEDVDEAEVRSHLAKGTIERKTKCRTII